MNKKNLMGVSALIAAIINVIFSVKMLDYIGDKLFAVEMLISLSAFVVGGVILTEGTRFAEYLANFFEREEEDDE